ncbi:peptidase inhibitor family I36 protein [Streptomyces sp. NPDC058394]|uniref:peptidase inhibitor family I36 protein n=1 Tax=Streptomyces sp. NPDC058394 TaxID=3346477 RepID=UPI003663A1EE
MIGLLQRRTETDESGHDHISMTALPELVDGEAPYPVLERPFGHAGRYDRRIILPGDHVYRAQRAIIVALTMTASLGLGACSSTDSGSAKATKDSSRLGVKDGLDGTAIPSKDPTSISAGGCDTRGEICLYDDVAFEGARMDISASDCPVSLANNDSVTSVVNNSPEYIVLYESTDHGGRFINIFPFSKIPDLRAKEFTVFHNDGNVAFTRGEFNDVLSSFCHQK